MTGTTLRERFTSAYSADELTAFCYDHFRPVYELFTPGMTKPQMVQHLLEYVAQQDLGPVLLAALDRERPGLIEDREAALDWLAAHERTSDAERDTGDRIYVGSITNSSAVAVGRGARATVYNYYVQTPASSLTPRELRQRQLMLDKVEAIWIKGFLGHSLPEEARIALNLEDRPDAVDLPTNALVQELNRPPQALPSGTSIVEVFDQMGGALLILGAPGTGKTSSLLELGRELIERARKDEQHPIPVVFNLSSWAVQRKSMKWWLVEELNLRYDVPRKVGRAWIEADAILPLLDGLDEVAAEYRDLCVDAINSYRQDEAMVPLAVCSRIADYEALTRRLRLQGAIVVQCLDAQQVESFLGRVGQPMAGVRTLLRDDPTLIEMLDTPLMLTVAVVAYGDRPAEELRGMGTVEERRRRLWDSYVERMFTRRSASTVWPREYVVSRLATLARQLQRRSETIFFVDALQPDWLRDRRARLSYALLDRLLGILLAALAGAVLGGAIFGPALVAAEWLRGVQDAQLLGAFTIGLGGGLVQGLVMGLYVSLFGGRRPVVAQSRPTLGIIGDVIAGGAVGGVVGGLVVATIIAMESGFDGALDGTFVGVLFGALAGALGGLLAGRPHLAVRTVHVTEQLSWSWRTAARGGLTGGLGGLFAGGLLGGLIFGVGGLYEESMVSPLGGILGVGLTGGLGIGVIGAFISGIVPGVVTTRSIPNQGVRRSARHALQVGLGIGLAGFLIFGIGGLAGDAPGLGLVLGLFIVVPIAILSLFVYGGFAVVSHLALRILLASEHVLPVRDRDLISLLDYAADRILLRRVGGGWIFIHRLLLEHLADQYEPDQLTFSATTRWTPGTES
jgi:eukaryotic-like serine/threonine-protein kinase